MVTPARPQCTLTRLERARGRQLLPALRLSVLRVGIGGADSGDCVVAIEYWGGK